MNREERKTYDATRKGSRSGKGNRREYFRAYRKSHPDKRKGDRHKRSNRHEHLIIGIDGEGYDLPDGRHVYSYMAAVDEHGEVRAEARNLAGLSFLECMGVLTALPRDALKFGFMISYDYTMMLRELPDKELYDLLHPDDRVRRACRKCKTLYSTQLHKRCPKPHCRSVEGVDVRRKVYFKGYGLDYMNGKLSVTSPEKTAGGNRRVPVVVWDVFRFFGCSFVKAIGDWRVTTAENVERVLSMKKKRGAFMPADQDSVEAYCREECEYLAQMMRKLIRAHADEDMRLTSYFGAGSTATTLLRKPKPEKGLGGYDIPDYKDDFASLDPELQKAALSAFFGGRFENSVIGRVEKKIYSSDIASAYPYALTWLPCLKHGKWKHVRFKGPIECKLACSGADLALCRFTVAPRTEKERKTIAWCPLPCRTENGSIVFGTGFSGWGWWQEVRPASLYWSDLVTITEAWLWHSTCEPCLHAQERDKPFGFLPEVYKKRIAWGKDGRGIVLKLGPNACYGKTAQRLGENPPFQSWIWAGACTATARGMLLEAIGKAQDPWSVLALATDGIFSTRPLDLPTALDTGTHGLKDPSTDEEKSALGAWDKKTIAEGLMLYKPGMYYRLAPKSPDDVFRARGLGRVELSEQRRKLEKGFDRWNKKDPDYTVKLKSRRFWGAKLCVRAMTVCECGKSWAGTLERMCPRCGKLGIEMKTGRAPVYGTWSQRDVQISFATLPKREAVMSCNRLRVRDLGGAESYPYEGVTSPEGKVAASGKEIALEQPEWYDFDDPID